MTSITHSAPSSPGLPGNGNVSLKVGGGRANVLANRRAMVGLFFLKTHTAVGNPQITVALVSTIIKKKKKSNKLHLVPGVMKIVIMCMQTTIWWPFVLPYLIIR